MSDPDQGLATGRRWSERHPEQPFQTLGQVVLRVLEEAIRKRSERLIREASKHER
ncbi:hypothetical protein RQ831_03870 [Roseomonas gilardii]|uniref:Uncharacterized protein n=1 Tax=Roseomonas gilardii TaxID=257708 RepID=A0ABU3MBB6_9PROT|nr:hypothetical protein [Roseomonas gilardii]MDT8330178.1 hypothetical protein [Roseomonas gilardii]